MLETYEFPNSGTLFTFFVLAAAIGTASFTIARAKVFESFRDWVEGKSEWFGNLFHCPYCVSHWLAWGAVAIYRPSLLGLWWPLDLFVTALAMVAVSMGFVWLIRKSLGA